jgi:hypothetical protein
MPSPISCTKIALTIVLVIVLVCAATFLQAVLAGLALPLFGDGGGTSAAFVVSDLLTRLVFVMVAAWVGTAPARTAATAVATTSAVVLGVITVLLMFISREPSAWYNYLGLFVVVGGTLLGSMFWRTKGTPNARATT